MCQSAPSFTYPVHLFLPSIFYLPPRLYTILSSIPSPLQSLRHLLPFSPSTPLYAFIPPILPSLHRGWVSGPGGGRDPGCRVDWINIQAVIGNVWGIAHVQCAQQDSLACGLHLESTLHGSSKPAGRLPHRHRLLLGSGLPFQLSWQQRS